MATSEHHSETSDGRETHVGRLIRKYANGRSLREIERQHGLSNYYLARYTRSDWDRRQLNLGVIDRFVTALGAPIEEVTEAFALDMELPLKGRALALDEVDLLDCFAACSTEGRDALMAMARVLREKLPANPRTSATP